MRMQEHRSPVCAPPAAASPLPLSPKGRGAILAALALAICPPLIIDEAQVDELVARLKKSLREAAAQAKKEGMI